MEHGVIGRMKESELKSGMRIALKKEVRNTPTGEMTS